MPHNYIWMNTIQILFYVVTSIHKQISPTLVKFMVCIYPCVYMPHKTVTVTIQIFSAYVFYSTHAMYVCSYSTNRCIPLYSSG